MTAAALHPWNHGGAWRDHTGPFRLLTPAQVERFDVDGFCVLERAVDGDTVAAVVAETDRLEAEADAILRSQAGGRSFIADADAITFSTHLVTRSPVLRAFASSPLFAWLAHDLIGPDVRLYWDQAVYKKPQKPRRFPWHQDNGYTFVEPQAYLTCWVALTDVTLANGCPQLAAGMHRLGTLAHRYVDPLGFECLDSPDDVRVVEAPAGSVVAFSSLTPHLTGPNTSGAVRKAYILQYAPDGAVCLLGDAAAGPPTSAEVCASPDRQFRILVGGERIADE